MNQNNNNLTTSNSKSDEVTLLEYYRIIMRKKWFTGIVVTVITIIALIYSLFATKTYRAQAIILPIGGGGGGGIAAMAAAAFGLSSIGGGTKNEQFMVLLGSRTLAEKIITKYDLKKILFAESWDKENNTWKDFGGAPSMQKTARILKGHMDFGEDKKTGVISVSAVSRDPKFSAKLANIYVENLREYINDNALTMAKRNRIFVEGQLSENKRELLNVGKTINEFYKGGRVSDVESRVDVLLSVTEAFDNESNLIIHDISHSKDLWSRIESEKENLQKKLQATEIVQDIPQQIYLQYLVLRRELLGKMNALLTQQYEMAKIEEGQKDLAFQIIDPAQVPELKYKPQRSKIVIFSFMASIFLAFFYIFSIEYIERMIGSKITIKIPFWRRISL